MKKMTLKLMLASLMMVLVYTEKFYEYFVNPDTLAAVGSARRGIDTANSQDATSSDPSQYTCDLDVWLYYLKLSKTCRIRYRVSHKY